MFLNSPLTSSVFPNFALIMLSFLSFIQPISLSKIRSPSRHFSRDGLYEFPSSSSTHAFVSTSSVPTLTLGAIWHSRLGHPAAPILSKALASCYPSVSFQINKIALCKICPLAKSHSLPYSLSSSHASLTPTYGVLLLLLPHQVHSIFFFSLMIILGIPGFIFFPPRTRPSPLSLPFEK